MPIYTVTRNAPRHSVRHEPWGTVEAASPREAAQRLQDECDQNAERRAVIELSTSPHFGEGAERLNGHGAQDTFGWWFVYLADTCVGVYDAPEPSPPPIA